MPARYCQPLRVTRDLPELLDGLEFQARPPLRAGDIVYAYEGPTRGLLPDDHRAIQLEPGEGPWYPVPVDAVEEPPASGSTSTFTEGNHL